MPGRQAKVKKYLMELCMTGLKKNERGHWKLVKHRTIYILQKRGFLLNGLKSPEIGDLISMLW